MVNRATASPSRVREPEVKTLTRAVTTLLASGGLVLSASPAMAAPPVGACPPAFETRDLPGQVALIEDLLGVDPEVAEELALAALPRYDKNDDTVLCFRLTKGHIVVIDNTAGGPG